GVSAQRMNADSLWSLWNNPKATDSVRWSSIHHVAWNMVYSNADSARVLAGIEIEFAVSKKNVLWEMAGTNTEGSTWFAQNKYPNALKLFQKTLQLAAKINLTKLDVSETRLYYINLGNAWHNMGNVYLYSSDYKKALSHFEKGLAIRLLNPKHDNLSASYTNLGIAQRRLANRKEALRYFRLSLQQDAANNDTKGVADNLLNIGSVLQDLMELDSARMYYTRSLGMFEKLNDQYGILNSYLGLGYSAKLGGRFSIAVENCTKALNMAKELGDKYNQQFCYQCLYETYHNQKNWENAYFNFRLWNEIQDSLFGAQKSRELTSLEMQFDYQKKTMADSLQRAEEKKLAEVRLKQEKTQRFALYGGILLLLVFGGFMYNRFRVTRKQKRLIEVQKNEVEKQKEESEYQKSIVEEKQKEILDSIVYAKRLQNAILAPPEEIKKHFPESFLLYKPKDIVAGDFYFFEYRNNMVFIAAADCTGHGVPGAMVSVICSNALARCVKEFCLTDPGKILDKTRELVIETFEKSGGEVKDGMDISLCSLKFRNSDLGLQNSAEKISEIRNPQSEMSLQWAGANNPLWILRKNAEALEEIRPNKQPIGVFAGASPFTTHQITVNSGDSFYIFTDGYADQFGGEKGKKFKVSNLKELIFSSRAASMNDQKTKIDAAFEDWKGNLEQIDDVCVMGLRIS
ncbi:MAG: tetratricopeptide repeat protein, partial [Flavobacteriales bacterium]